MDRDLALLGGDGPDLLRGGRGDDLLRGGGGGGDDQLFGHGGAVWLLGGDGNDALNGGAGDDFLGRGDGADELRGGRGACMLHFAAGDGADLVLDFQAGRDRIAIDLGAGDFDDLRITQSGADGDRIELHGIDPSDLDPCDFLFG